MFAPDTAPAAPLAPAHTHHSDRGSATGAVRDTSAGCTAAVTCSCLENAALRREHVTGAPSCLANGAGQPLLPQRARLQSQGQAGGRVASSAALPAGAAGQAPGAFLTLPASCVRLWQRLEDGVEGRHADLHRNADDCAPWCHGLPVLCAQRVSKRRAPGGCQSRRWAALPDAAAAAPRAQGVVSVCCLVGQCVVDRGARRDQTNGRAVEMQNRGGLAAG